MVIRKTNDTDIQNIAELYILNWKTILIFVMVSKNGVTF